MMNMTLMLQKADAHSLTYNDGSFDVAVLILTILNSKMLEETARVLRPGKYVKNNDF